MPTYLEVTVYGSEQKILVAMLEIAFVEDISRDPTRLGNCEIYMRGGINPVRVTEVYEYFRQGLGGMPSA